MIINWRGSTVYAGLTFNSTSTPLVYHGINYRKITEPTNLLEFNARVTVGNKQYVARRVDAPTQVFEEHVKSAPTWEIICICDVIWSKIGDWDIIETDTVFWTPDGLIVFEEVDVCEWNVSTATPGTWEIIEEDEISWVVKIDGTRENCLTGDGEIDILSVLLPQIW